MSFTFIHTADWQIGKAFAGFPADVAAALREARISAIDRIAEAAVRAGARHVLVAGDVFDADTLAPKTVAQAVARMARHQHLTWHLLPGNHDAHRAGGLWERLLRDGLPAHVRPVLSAQPIEIDKETWLLPAPLSGRATGSDPTLYMDTAPTPPGARRIGLAHGSIRGFGSEQAAAVGLSPSRAASAGLDYLALGDWHGCLEISAKTWYSGTPEPEGFKDNAPGFVLAVEVNGAGAPPRIERVPTAQFAWVKSTLPAASLMDFTTASLDANRVKTGQNRPQHDTLWQLSLSGRMTPGERQDVLVNLKRLEAGYRHLDADLSALTLTSTADALDQLDGAGDLKPVAERLLARASDPTSADATIATEALALLLDLAAETRGAAA
jgi:hypothetical protein